MGKLLEKTLRDAVKENQCIIGSKQVLSSISDSKLVVLSKSIPSQIREKIVKDAKEKNIPTLDYDDTSVTLGRLCGLHFHVSAASLLSTNDSKVKSIIGEFSSA